MGWAAREGVGPPSRGQPTGIGPCAPKACACVAESCRAPFTRREGVDRAGAKGRRSEGDGRRGGVGALSSGLTLEGTHLVLPLRADPQRPRLRSPELRSDPGPDSVDEEAYVTRRFCSAGKEGRVPRSTLDTMVKCPAFWLRTEGEPIHSPPLVSEPTHVLRLPSLRWLLGAAGNDRPDVESGRGSLRSHDSERGVGSEASTPTSFGIKVFKKRDRVHPTATS